VCDSSQLSDQPRESFDQNRQGRKEQHRLAHPSMSKDRDTFSPVGKNHGSSHDHDDHNTSNVDDSLSDCDILDLDDDCYESLDGSKAYDASLDQELSTSTDSNPPVDICFPTSNLAPPLLGKVFV